MWLLRIVLFLVLLALLIVVALANGQAVDVEIFGRSFSGVRLFVVMFASALLGFVAGLLMLALRETQLRLRLSRERRERDVVEREVRQLRAAPIQDLPPAPEAAGTLPPRVDE